MKKNKRHIWVGMLFTLLLSVYLTGCGSDTTATVGENLSEEGYKALCVGNGCGDESMKAVQQGGNSNKMIVVLPASVDSPSDAVALSGATVTFFDDSSELKRIQTDARGYFEIPEDVLNSVKSADSPPEVVVTDASGEGNSVSVVLPVAIYEDDSKRRPISLKIIPMSFVMPDGAYRLFHAVKVLPNGKIKRAKHVDWNCDAAGNGVLSEFYRGPRGGFVICHAEEDMSGEVMVSGAIRTAGGLQLKDQSEGKVYLKDNAITVTGTVFENHSGTAVEAGYLVNFIHHSEGRFRPYRFVGRTNVDGIYKLFLPEVDDEAVLYRTLIRTPRVKGGELHKGIPESVEFSTEDNGTTVEQDLTIGEIIPPFFPPPSFERVIRHSWRQAKMGALPFYFEPFHGIRRLFYQPDGEGIITHRGKFNGYCYDKADNELTITPPDSIGSCPNVNTDEKIEITKLSHVIEIDDLSYQQQYEWVKSLKPAGFALFHKANSGNVTDIINCTVVSDGEGGDRKICRIAEIDSLIQHFFLDLPDDPKSTGIWNWMRKFNDEPVNEIDSSHDEFIPLHRSVEITGKICSGDNEWNDNDLVERPCGDGAPLGKYLIQRNRPQIVILEDKVSISVFPTTLFTFFGKSTQYVRMQDDSFRRIFNRLCSEDYPCKVMTDRSGNAVVRSTTDGIEDGKAHTSFKVLSLKERMATGILAKGRLTLNLGHIVKKVRFVIDKFNHVHILRIWHIHPALLEVDLDDAVEFDVESDSIEEGRLMMFDS